MYNCSRNATTSIQTLDVNQKIKIPEEYFVFD